MEATDPVEQTAAYVKAALAEEASGHDWWHTYRVWKAARRIAEAEGADLRIVELAALLHDLADWKAHGGDTTIGPAKAREWLARIGVAPQTVEQVCRIIADMSFKGAGVVEPALSLEGKVVQDADRLDAIGAIGIARAFAYGGARGRLLHDPDVPPQLHQSAEAYLQSRGTTIHHFYEKLLLLADRMHTPTGRAIAASRHRFLEEYLQRFFDEWEGG